MKGAGRVARREYRAYLTTPWCYGVAVAFLVLTGITFFIVTEGTREATLRFWFPNLAFVSLVTMPVVTSRTFADEVRVRHLDVLLARPVSPVGLIVGKWMAVVGLFLTYLLPSIVYAGFLSAWGDPDWPPILTSYLGAILNAALFAAVGTLTSVLTSSAVLAGLASFAILVMLQLGNDVPGLSALSYVDPLDAFARGAPRLTDFVYFLSAPIVCLGVAAVYQKCRRSAVRVRRLVAPATALALVASANFVAVPIDKVFDVTSTGRFTLSRASREALGNIDGMVTITAFEPGGSPLARDDEVLLEQFQDVRRGVRYRVLDLERNQGEAIRLGIDNYGQAAVEFRSRREVVSPITELTIVSALQRLARRLPQRVCALTGHGERSLDDPGPRGYSVAKTATGLNGIATKEIDLTVDQRVPADCTMLALLDPKTPLRSVEHDALAQYLRHEGKMLITIEPGGPDLEPLTTQWGLRLLPGTVFDPVRSVADDPTALIVNKFPADSPLTHNVAGVAVVTAGGVTTAASEARGLAVSPVFASSEAAWLDAEPSDRRHQQGAERSGPVVLGGAADGSSVAPEGEARIPSGGPKINRTRLVLFADADWASNAFVKELANQALLANTLNWLAGEEDLVAVRGLTPDLRRLEPTSERRRLMGVVSLGVVPGAALCGGIGLWFWRRRRYS